MPFCNDVKSCKGRCRTVPWHFVSLFCSFNKPKACEMLGPPQAYVSWNLPLAVQSVIPRQDRLELAGQHAKFWRYLWAGIRPKLHYQMTSQQSFSRKLHFVALIRVKSARDLARLKAKKYICISGHEEPQPLTGGSESQESFRATKSALSPAYV